MKRISRIVLILSVPLIVKLLISCCDCIDTTFYDYSNCGLVINNLDNSGASPVITLETAIPKNAYGIRISINRSIGTCEVKRNNSLFIQSAYAIHCECPPLFQYNPFDSIASVTIRTINDFDSAHSGGSDVSKLFYVFKRNEFIKLSEYVKNLSSILYDEKNPVFDPVFEFDLLLMSPPAIGNQHEFEVTIELSDSRIFNAQTGIIELN